MVLSVNGVVLRAWLLYNVKLITFAQSRAILSFSLYVNLF